MNWLTSKVSDLEFKHAILGAYRDVRRVYYYEHQPEDVVALGKCARDLRPYGYSFLPGGLAWWLSGKLVKPKQRSLGLRMGIVLLRWTAAVEVFRLGWLLGSYKQATSCVERLVALQTALGGEIAAIIRQQDPQHPLLKLERPPAVFAEDGSRPRIKSEPNRLAQIERLRAQLAAAQRGQRARSPAELSEDLLGRQMEHKQEMVETIRQGGGLAAVAATGDLGAISPAEPSSTHHQQQQQEHAGPGVGSSSSMGSRGQSNGPQGLVIDGTQTLSHASLHGSSSGGSTLHDDGVIDGTQPPEQQQLGSSPEIFDLLLSPDGEVQRQGEQGERAQPRKSRDRRKRQWWIKSGSASSHAEEF